MRRFIESSLSGKVISLMEEVHDGYVSTLVVECTDGTIITFFGGTVGYDSADPAYEITWKTPTA